MSEWEDELSYSLFLLGNSWIGTRKEREYLEREKAKRSLKTMSSMIKDYRYMADFEADGEID